MCDERARATSKGNAVANPIITYYLQLGLLPGARVFPSLGGRGRDSNSGRCRVWAHPHALESPASCFVASICYMCYVLLLLCTAYVTQSRPFFFL